MHCISVVLSRENIGLKDVNQKLGILHSAANDRSPIGLQMIPDVDRR